MSKELIERLRSKAAKRGYGEYSDHLMTKAADELESLRRNDVLNQQIIADLRAQLKGAQADAAHWKNNHETEVRRARILKERTDMPIERVDAYEQWGKDQMALKEAQEAAEFNFQQYQDAGRLLCEAQAEIEKLKAYYAQVFKDRERQIQIHKENAAASQARISELEMKLAASQANEVKLREALEDVAELMLCGKKDHLPGRCDKASKRIIKVLSLPSDTTAIDTMIQKAGEVMRERCACSMEDYLDDPMLSGHGYANGAGMEIRTLPGVTLEDLK